MKYFIFAITNERSSGPTTTINGQDYPTQVKAQAAADAKRRPSRWPEAPVCWQVCGYDPEKTTKHAAVEALLARQGT
jgi:hypothetical protein